jgi:hypothetical protein
VCAPPLNCTLGIKTNVMRVELALFDGELHMPIHESDDWETIELENYTFAFWCHLDA